MSLRAPARRIGTEGLGFTLVEIVISLAIVTLLLGIVIVPLRTQVESRNIAETQRLLEQARDALLDFAVTYGYFPCPADAASAGLEAAGADHATGVCPSYHGFLPAALLKFTPVDAQGYALDAWGGAPAYRLRYAVSNQTVGGIANPFTRSGGMSAAGVPSLGAANNLFHICGGGSGVNPGADCGTAQALSTNAVVVVWSVGENATSGGTSVHEAENPNPNGGSADRIFVSRARSAGAGADYDDVVIWLHGLGVVSRLVAAGQLP